MLSGKGERRISCGYRSETALVLPMRHDPSEKYNVAGNHPEVVQELLGIMRQHNADMVPGPPQR